MEFLEWLLQLNFVLLGYREYELSDTDEGRAIQAVPGSGLGIISEVGTSTFADWTPLSSLAPDIRNRIEDGELLIFEDPGVLDGSPPRADGLHRRPEGGRPRHDRRRGPPDRAVHEQGVHGARHEDPLLHHKLEQVIAGEDLIPGSHDYKAVVSLFESFPKDELFQASADEIRKLVVGLLQLEKHGGIRVLIRRDLYGRNVSVVVALPRDRFNADLRKALRPCSWSGSTAPRSTTTSRSARRSRRGSSSRSIAPGIPIPDVRYEELELEVERLARTWEDDLLERSRAGWVGTRGPAGRVGAFPDYYKSNDEWDLVVDDIVLLEKLESTPDRFLVGIGNESKGERLTRVKLYKTGGKVDLSDFMPILEALGVARRRGGPDGDRGRGPRLHPRLRRPRSPWRGARAGRGRRPRHRHDRGRVARRLRIGLVEPSGGAQLAHVVGDAGPPRAPQLPDARVGPYTENYRNDAMASISLDLRTADPDVRGEVRCRAGRLGGGDRRDPAGDPPRPPGSPRWTRTTSCDTCWGRSRRSCGPTPTCRIVGT